MEVASSRKEAKANNLGFYHGKSCPTCSGTVRYTASANCRTCHLGDERASWKKQWYANRAESVKDKRLQRAYGIGLKDYERMYAEQDGKCAICKEPKETLCVDHCHTSLDVRGLLCHQCNQAIGLLRDDPGILENAIGYLQNGSKISRS